MKGGYTNISAQRQAPWFLFSWGSWLAPACVTPLGVPGCSWGLGGLWSPVHLCFRKCPHLRSSWNLDAGWWQQLPMKSDLRAGVVSVPRLPRHGHPIVNASRHHDQEGTQELPDQALSLFMASPRRCPTETLVRGPRNTDRISASWCTGWINEGTQVCCPENNRIFHHLSSQPSSWFSRNSLKNPNTHTHQILIKYSF